MKYKRNIKVIITFLLFLGLVPPKKVWKIIYPIPPKNPTRITYMKRLIDKNEYILIMIIHPYESPRIHIELKRLKITYSCKSKMETSGSTTVTVPL